MMREIRRVAPMRFANVMAVFYGVIFATFYLLTVSMVLLVHMPMHTAGGQEIPRPPLLGMLALYPVMGLVMGWLGGLLFAAIYNVVARHLGGVRVEIDADPTVG